MLPNQPQITSPATQPAPQQQPQATTQPPQQTAPAQLPATIETQADREKQYDLNVAELLFAVSSYCYIRSSQLAYDSINNLNTELVMVLKEFVLQTQKEEQNMAKLSELDAELRKENQSSADFASSHGVQATTAPQADSSEEEEETPIQRA